jgi:hypothetical protein
MFKTKPINRMYITDYLNKKNNKQYTLILNK